MTLVEEAPSLTLAHAVPHTPWAVDGLLRSIESIVDRHLGLTCVADYFNWPRVKGRLFYSTSFYPRLKQGPNMGALFV